MISIQELRLTRNSDVMNTATTVFQILMITDNINNPPITYTQVSISHDISHPNYPDNIFQNTNQPFYPNNNVQNQALSNDEQNKLNFFAQNQIQPITSKTKLKMVYLFSSRINYNQH